MRDRCCGCAHRGFGSRPALVQPPRMRVGLNPTRGTADPAPRRSASFAHAKWPLSMKGVPDRTNRCWSRSSGRNGLGGSCPGGPTRRRERWSQENRSGRGDRNVRGWSHGQGRRIKSPALSRSLESEVNGTRRSGDTGVRAHPLPRIRGGPQSPSLRARCKPRGQYREPASTGNRSREFGKQTSDERIDRCFFDGASQGATSQEVPSLKEAGTWLEEIPDDQGRWR